MAPVKRSRDVEHEELNNIALPKSKQTRIGDYFTSSFTNNHSIKGQRQVFTIKTSNRFSPLEGACEHKENIEDGLNTHDKNPVNDHSPDAEIYRREWQSPIKSHTEEILTPENFNSFDLIAKTVDCIFRKVSNIATQLNLLTFEVERLSDTIDKLHQVKSDTLPAELQKINQNDEQQFKQKAALTPANYYKLILKPNMTCLTICSYKGLLPIWRNKQQIKSHLSALLKINFSTIDLTKFELINHQSQAMKILLTFCSSRIPSIIQRHEKSLRTKGIFPTRVFHNLTVADLFSKGPNPKTETNKTMQEGLTTQEPPQPDLIKWDEVEMPSGPDDFINSSYDNQIHSSLENSTEEHLIHSFGNLPLLEQQAILKRLDMVKSKLQTQQLSSKHLNQSPGKMDVTGCNLELLEPTHMRLSTQICEALPHPMQETKMDFSPSKQIFINDEQNGKQIFASHNDGHTRPKFPNVKTLTPTTDSASHRNKQTIITSNHFSAKHKKDHLASDTQPKNGCIFQDTCGDLEKIITQDALTSINTLQTEEGTIQTQCIMDLPLQTQKSPITSAIKDPDK